MSRKLYSPGWFSIEIKTIIHYHWKRGNIKYELLGKLFKKKKKSLSKIKSNIIKIAMKNLEDPFGDWEKRRPLKRDPIVVLYDFRYK